MGLTFSAHPVVVYSWPMNRFCDIVSCPPQSDYKSCVFTGLSVSLQSRCRPSKTTERIQLVLAHGCLWLILHCDGRKFAYLQNKGTSPGTLSFVTNSGLKSNFATARGVLSTQVDAQCDKLVMVVGHQFSTLSVHFCVQHDGRDAARRAGLSAAESCLAFLDRLLRIDLIKSVSNVRPSVHKTFL